MRRYLNGRGLWYSTTKERKMVEITRDVRQDSVLGPLLWNMMHDGVFRVSNPERAKIIGFADDIAVVVAPKNLAGIRNNVTHAVMSMQSWLAKNNLELTQQKIKPVLKKPEKVSFRTLFDISTVPAIKYLGIMID